MGLDLGYDVYSSLYVYSMDYGFKFNDIDKNFQSIFQVLSVSKFRVGTTKGDFDVAMWQ